MRRAARAAAIAALVGAVLWVVELVLVVITDGGAADDGPARWLALGGWALVLVGATGVGAGLAWGRRREVLIAAAVVAPLLAWLSVLLLDTIGAAVLPGATPEHLATRFDTGLGALLWASLAIAALDRLGRRRAPRATRR